VSKQRFYKSATLVSVDDTFESWGIELDGRPVRTPSGNALNAPVKRLAEAMVTEWNNQGKQVIPASMPLCGLANAAVDRIGPQRTTFIEKIKGHANSDLVCYWAEFPPDLVKSQHDTWQPLIDWANKSFGTAFQTTVGIKHIDQPEESISIMGQEAGKFDDFALAAFTDLETTLGSVIIAMSLYHQKINLDQAFDAAFLDELFQIDRWGEDQEAAERRKGVREELAATHNFINLLDCTA